jgi:hypothetical protein
MIVGSDQAPTGPARSGRPDNKLRAASARFGSPAQPFAWASLSRSPPSNWSKSRGPETDPRLGIVAWKNQPYFAGSVGDHSLIAEVFS